METIVVSVILFLFICVLIAIYILIDSVVGLIIDLFIVVAFVTVLVISHMECKKFKTTKYELKDINKVGFNGLKIVMLADMHNCWFDKDNHSIIASIKDYKPDIIVIAGDMIVCRAKHIKNNLKTAEFVNALADIAPVYYGYGNHEMGVSCQWKNVGNNWEEYVSLLNKKVHLMDNERVEITKDNQRFTLYGLNIKGMHYERIKVVPLNSDDVANYVGKADENSYNILIAHHPDYFKSYMEWGADLVLSGHNHGGLIKLPFLGGVISPRLHLFPKYTYGMYRHNKGKMILTNGLGAHSLKIRVNNVPEIVFINLK